MKYGVREICDVVLKAKDTMVVGNKKFYKHEPVIYFDTLKTSSLEGASTTVYAQGGRGNARLMAWEGERTVTFNMEDALISPVGFMILSGAGLTEAKKDNTIKVHTTDSGAKMVKDSTGAITVTLDAKAYIGDSSTTENSITLARDGNTEHYIYVMVTKDGEVVSEPYLPKSVSFKQDNTASEKWTTTLTMDSGEDHFADIFPTGVTEVKVLVDFYVEQESDAFQIDITPDSFGGNFYLEASTLFRDTNGTDRPAEFIIPNCKIQSNFTFTMASSGDPSSFNFVMDAFPDYTRFSGDKKVLAALQIVGASADGSNSDSYRTETYAGYDSSQSGT